MVSARCETLRPVKIEYLWERSPTDVFGLLYVFVRRQIPVNPPTGPAGSEIVRSSWGNDVPLIATRASAMRVGIHAESAIASRAISRLGNGRRLLILHP